MMHRIYFLLLSCAASFCHGFTPQRGASPAFHVSASQHNVFPEVATAAAAFVVANVVPAVVLAVEENYEYGAVDAPISIAWVAGIFAILTAALPLLLRSGEEAFEEMRERDSDTFGAKNDILKKKKK
jgi:beta-lactamase regulating signal transducer with metallopeptidase domain